MRFTVSFVWENRKTSHSRKQTRSHSLVSSLIAALPNVVAQLNPFRDERLALVAQTEGAYARPASDTSRSANLLPSKTSDLVIKQIRGTQELSRVRSEDLQCQLLSMTAFQAKPSAWLDGACAIGHGVNYINNLSWPATRSNPRLPQSHDVEKGIWLDANEGRRPLLVNHELATHSASLVRNVLTSTDRPMRAYKASANGTTSSPVRYPEGSDILGRIERPEATIVAHDSLGFHSRLNDGPIVASHHVLGSRLGSSYPLLQEQKRAAVAHDVLFRQEAQGSNIDRVSKRKRLSSDGASIFAGNTASLQLSGLATTKARTLNLVKRTSRTSIDPEGLRSHQKLSDVARKEHVLPKTLPAMISLPQDRKKLSAYQQLLRNQIEFFAASWEDVATHTRGRNRPITFRQVGIRCRHCRHVPYGERKKGSVYFPFSLLRIYQAGQNMGIAHFNGTDCCEHVPTVVREGFADSLTCRSTIGSGKTYWAEAATRLGLVDTDDGIRFAGHASKKEVGKDQ